MYDDDVECGHFVDDFGSSWEEDGIVRKRWPHEAPIVVNVECFNCGHRFTANKHQHTNSALCPECSEYNNI